MQKEECNKDYDNYNLKMSDEKCKDCEYLYECKYMMDEMNDVVYGGFK